jgi:hypothetical protein
MIDAPRHLPTFIIGGAPRSGTTFLCHVLDKHPDVYLAKPFIPEPKVCLTPCSLGTKGYRERYYQLFADVKHEKVLGEKSSAYLENRDAFERLKLTLNETRFLFIVREPVKRAYSNYLRSRANGLETLSFAAAVEAEGTRTDPFPPEKSYVRPFDYLIRGDYATFAERYLSAFGPKQVKFVLFEDIILSPDRFYREIQTFVQVDPLTRDKLETEAVNSSDKSNEPLEKDLEHQLRERMRSSVLRFADLTGLDIGAWGY